MKIEITQTKATMNDLVVRGLNSLHKVLGSNLITINIPKKKPHRT